MTCFLLFFRYSVLDWLLFSSFTRLISQLCCRSLFSSPWHLHTNRGISVFIGSLNEPQTIVKASLFDSWLYGIGKIKLEEGKLKVVCAEFSALIMNGLQ